MSEQDQVTCRKCTATYVPTFRQDFYVDDKAGPGTGLCERCMMSEAFAPKDPQPIPSEIHRQDVCKIGKAEATCSYLVFSDGWRCAKQSGLERLINKKREEGMRAMGNNCSGPPDFLVNKIATHELPST